MQELPGGHGLCCQVQSSWPLFDNGDSMVHRYVLVLTLVTAAFCQRPVAASPELTVQEAVDLLDGALQSVKSFDVRVDCSITFLIKYEHSESVSNGKKMRVVRSRRKRRADEPPKVKRESIRQVFQRGKGRIEFLGKDSPSATKVVSYDDETMRSFSPGSRTLAIRDRPEHIAGFDGWEYLHTYRNVEGPIPLLHCLRERKNVSIKQDARDDSLVILETPPCPEMQVEYARSGFRVTLDKAHGFMPVVTERFQRIGEQNFTDRETRVVEWKDVGGRIWVPVKAVTRYFDPEPPLFGEVSSEQTLVVDVPRSSWNREYPEATFDLPIPAGTQVQDGLQNVHYITGKPDPGKNLTDLAAHAVKLVHLPPRARTNAA
jgi:hypothetical protein